MLRAEKARVAEGLHGVFAATGVVVVAHYKGLSVPEITELRGSVRRAGGGFRVTKNTLARLALDGTAFEGMAVLFKGPTAVAWSADPVAAPKAIVEYARKNEKLAIVGGGLSGALLDAAAVRALAELPPLEAVRGGLVGLLQAPAARILGVLQAPAGQLARVLAAYAEKAGVGGDGGESGGGEAAGDAGGAPSEG